MGRLTIAGHALMLSALLLCLTGCVSLPNQSVGPAAIRQSSAGLEVSICDSIDASTFVLEVRIANEWSRAWVAQGGASIAGGQVLSAATLTESFPRADVLVRDLSGASDFSVVVTSVAGGENIVAGFDASKLASDGWLHPDDTVSDRPCP
jgi:hypothetical protein